MNKLWKKIVKGDKTAFDMLYFDMVDELFSYALTITRDRFVIEEAIQCAFVKLWLNRDRLEIHSSIKAYLMQCLHNNVIDQKKKSATIIDINLDIPKFVQEENVESRIISDELHDKQLHLLTFAKRKLSKRQKEIVFLKCTQGFDYDEIGQIMGLSKSAAYKLYYLAVNRLRETILQEA